MFLGDGFKICSRSTNMRLIGSGMTARIKIKSIAVDCRMSEKPCFEMGDIDIKVFKFSRRG